MTPHRPRLNLWERKRRRSGLLLGLLIGLLLLLLWNLGIFQSTRLRLNNLYFVPQPTRETVVIVALDDRSLAAYGRSPVSWDRQLYADLLYLLHEGGARVVTFDLLFAESTPQDEAFAAAIAALRQGETRTRVVLPMVGGEQLRQPAADGPPRIQFTQRLQPVPALAAAAEYLAFANSFRDVDGTLRRQPSYVSIVQQDGGEQLFFSLNLATLLAYSGIPPAAAPQLLESQPGALQLTPALTPERVLPIDEFGLWQQHYFGQGGRSFPIYSMQAVLDGELNPALFEDRIVLVGLANVSGLLDQHVVPLGLNGQTMAGVEVQANAVETLLQWLPLRPLPPGWQMLLILGLSIGASLLYSTLRWYWVLPLMGLLLLLFGGFSFLLFDTQQFIIDLLDGGLALALPSIAVLSLNVALEVSRRRRVEFLLQSVVEVSTQQLNLHRIAPLIAEDIQQIINTVGGAIWLYTDDSPGLQLLDHWFPQPEQAQASRAASQQAAHTLRPVIAGAQAAIPLRWQNRALGVFFVQLPPQHNLQGEELRLLETLAEQIAPSLDNARLFTQTERQKTLLQTIQDGSPNAIIVLDDRLAVWQMNPRANALFDLPLDEFLGQPMQHLLESTPITPELQVELLAKLAQPIPFFEEIRLEKHVHFLYALPLANAQKWVLIFNDVTSLAELSELKTQMIRMASHDLKNPLSRVRGYSDMILDAEDMAPAQQRLFVQRIQQAAEDMLNIITDILSLEQLRARKMERAPVDLRQVLQAALAEHRPDAEAKQQQIISELPEELPLIDGDARLLEQAFRNLLSNAVKYTPPEGEIRLRLYTGEENTVHFEVQDTGYGIPEAAQAKLFTQFYRVRTQATAHIAGTGLGLSLVKSIVEDHGGKISFHSQEGQGSTFSIELPAA